jgi:dTDP-4-amino-4,6-dideoxygalactose transaminase
MCAILLEVAQDDEIIVPSFTFVSTANAFILRGANIVFADSSPNSPNIDTDNIESLITTKTKAIVVVHYGGIACDMEKVLAIAKKYNLYIIEDAAHSIDSFYKGKPLGSIGHLAAFSFHETKNITSGEGGMLVINDERFSKRAEIISEKGTNRAAFYRGEIDKYGWVDIGSSFMPPDIIAAFLYAQLEQLDLIQNKRKALWQAYYRGLKPLEKKGYLSLPEIPDFASNNGHLFYIVSKKPEERTHLITYLQEKGIQAVFHYQSLHNSEFYSRRYSGKRLLNSDRYSSCLLRLPLYYELREYEVDLVVKTIREFFEKLA